MKRFILLCLFFAFLLVLSGCKREPPLQEHSSNLTTAIDASTTKPEPRKRHEYNRENPGKNLFLQFLHDEISYVGEKGEARYFSDFHGITGENENSFYIVDMDGDGKPEFWYQDYVSTDIFRYSEDKDCFELWLYGRRQMYPLGVGKIYEHHSSASSVTYAHHSYDKNANLIESIFYEKGISPPYVEEYFKIDDVAVSEDEWNTASAWLFELIKNAPNPLSYKELYDA